VAKIHQEIAASHPLADGSELAVRILNVAQTYYPYLAEGGRPAKVRALSRKLVARGHAVTVLTANLGLSEWCNGGLFYQETAIGIESTDDGVKAIYLPTLTRYRVLTLNPNVIRFCRAYLAGFDVVHFYGIYDLLGPIVSYFCRRKGIPYVIEPMGMYRPIDRNIPIKKCWHHTVGRTFWRGAAQIIATSELEQEDLVQDGVPQKRIAMRYNGIDCEPNGSISTRGGFRSKWGISADEPLILFLSRLIPRKGADLLIEAFAQAFPESGKLVIAGPEGESGYCAQLEKCAQASGIAARVIFTGPLYDEEKKLVLTDADIFALPSRYENFANVAAEAIACGIPVIVTPFCGIHSLVDGRAGLVVRPEKEQLATALRLLFDDKLLYAHLKRGCREITVQLSWDHLTEQMECYYKGILAQDNGFR